MEILQRVKGYILDDTEARIMLVAQLVKITIVIIVYFPSRLLSALSSHMNEAIFNEYRTFFIIAHLANMVAIVAIIALLTMGKIDRIMGRLLKDSNLTRRDWRKCSSCSFSATLLFYFAVQSSWLLVIPAVIYFLVCFDADYRKPPQDDDD